uniref:Helicase with zinc finger domain 2-like n=1 Tax=Saccoglossus kowalevskii TaxID=10224 RepID=A0ABM0M7M7_SACKO|nr:PREDICTED: helicase with zinc finger domain 2-like [Saccoglossus kowalevskii]
MSKTDGVGAIPNGKFCSKLLIIHRIAPAIYGEQLMGTLQTKMENDEVDISMDDVINYTVDDSTDDSMDDIIMDDERLKRRAKIDVIKNLVASNVPTEILKPHLSTNILYLLEQEGDVLYDDGYIIDAWQYYNDVFTFHRLRMEVFGSADTDHHMRVPLTMKRIRCVLRLPTWNPFLRISALGSSLEQCNEALKVEPRNTDMLLLTAEVCAHLGQFEDAYVYIKRSERILGQDDGIQELKVRIARTYEEIFETEEMKKFVYGNFNSPTKLEDIVTISRNTVDNITPQHSDKPDDGDPNITLDRISKHETAVHTVPSIFCAICPSKKFSSYRHLDAHRRSIEHRRRQHIDSDRFWCYRPPPWGVDNISELQLCPNIGDTDVNTVLCPYAHSDDELREWKDRVHYRHIKKLKENGNSKSVYLGGILTAIQRSVDLHSVIKEDLFDVIVNTTTPDLVELNESARNCDTFMHTFSFTITSKEKRLFKVGLLLDPCRQFFTFADDSGNPIKDEVIDGDLIIGENGEYKINVQFSSTNEGVYHQWVICDFGERPLLVKRLAVHAGEIHLTEDDVDVKSVFIDYFNDPISHGCHTSNGQDVVPVAQHEYPYYKFQMLSWWDYQSFRVGDFSESSYSHFNEQRRQLCLKEMVLFNHILRLHKPCSLVINPGTASDAVFVDLVINEMSTTADNKINRLQSELTRRKMPSIVVNTLRKIQGSEFLVVILFLSAQPTIVTHSMDLLNLLLCSISKARNKFYVIAYPGRPDCYKTERSTVLHSIMMDCNNKHSLEYSARNQDLLDNLLEIDSHNLSELFKPTWSIIANEMVSLYNASDTDYTCNEDTDDFSLETHFLQGTTELNERLSDDCDYSYFSDDDFNDYSGEECFPNNEDVLFKELPKHDLEEHLKVQPEKYKRCRLETQMQEQDRVTPLDEEPDFEIRIPNKLKRGRALDQDTVVIELMDENRNEILEMGDDKVDTKIKYGKVVGILERHEEPRMKKIACMLGEHSDNLLVPINGNFPKMSWLKGQLWKETNKHAVCLPIYRITRFLNFELDHIEEVTTSERSQKIFIARFLHWNVNRRYPLCVAVDVLPMGNTLENGLNILKAKYDVKDNSTTLEPSVESHCVRRDLFATPTFTIDPNDARDLDDALSLETLENGNFRIGVHIADVASYIPVDSSVDIAARKRGTSYYLPDKHPIHMLPRWLSEGTCSLQPNTEKNALSHLFEVNTAGHVLSQYIIQTKIKPVHQLSYEEAERIITSGNIQDEFHEISSQLVSLNELAQKMRRQRLGMAHFLTEYGSYGEEPHTTPFAQQLVEEMMIMTNTEVAKMLVAKYPSCTPLRRQLKPQKKHFEQWLDSFDSVMKCSINISSKPSISANNVNGEFVIMDKFIKQEGYIYGYNLDKIQTKVLLTICSERITGPCSPLMVLGPTGSGKTTVIDIAAAILLEQRIRKYRKHIILISTNTVSCARVHLENIVKYVKKYPCQNIIRLLLPKGVSMSEIGEPLQKYSFTWQESQEQCNTNWRIVITTTNNCHSLLTRGMANRFTHVFIDEADQAAYQSIIPSLALTSSSGKIIIVGDLAQQLESKVGSCTVGDKSAMILFLRHYSIKQLFLKRIYRFTEGIRRFVNTHMYPDINIVGNVESSTKDEIIPIHAIIPLVKVKEPSLKEIDTYQMLEITYRVEQLYRDWPEEWGEFNEKSIGIIVECQDQVTFEDQNFPQLFLMAVHFYGIQEKAEYVCSDPDKTKPHFTLNCPVYVRCTSPIRRYMDLVIQRMVIAAIYGDESPYNKEEIVKMCTMCNQTEDKQKCFESDCRALKFALKVHNTPLKAMAVVETANDSSIDLQILRIRSIPSSERKIPLSLMKISTQPKYDEATESLRLSWLEHIYDSKLGENNTVKPTTPNNTTIQLQRMRHTFATSTETWYNFIMSVLHGNQHNSRRLITQLEQERRKCNRENAVTHDISSERIDKKGNRIDPCCFTRNFRMSDVLELQIGAHYSRGMLSPNIESVKLSEDFSICIEHRKDAVGCFSVNAEKKMPSLRNRHGWDINNYQNRWITILSMSAAESAVRHNENIFIKSLSVTWSVSSQGEYIGTFFLPSNFCESRHITFHSSIGDQGHDYICVKCQQFSVKKRSTPKFTNGDTLFFDNNFCWIAHCIVSRVQVEKKDGSEDGTTIVDIKLKSTSVNILEQCLTSEQSSVEQICTVEIIKKSIPDRRVEDTVRMLRESSEFVQQIALGHPPKRQIPRQQSLRRLVMKVSTNKREGLPSLNEDQFHAIKMSLENKFTVVQGPPGTGKSYMAANLANAFVLSNRDEPSMKGGRILYCAPSNKAVDVAAGIILTRFDMNIIRMYSKSMEGKDYPVPGLTDITQYKRGNNAESSPALDDIALHRVIRKAPSKYGNEIRQFDSRFRNAAIPSSKKDIEDYKALIKKAEKDALIGCDVILCTCSEAASKRLDKLCILQCIIDEAGMCTEPETLVPLVRANPEQVVLIGDHRQLQPIVTHNLSNQMGLGVSLLERYCDQNHFIRLKIQYRMHNAICEFPNNQFYDGDLETAETVLKRSQLKTTMDGVWPGGKHVPTVFCHSVGKEESLKVTTDEGSEHSKKNLQEVKDVVRIAKILTTKYGLAKSRIQILSQYRAQCHEITGELKGVNCQNIGVNSVIGFQGSEQDYIILSTVRSLPQREIEERPTKGWLKKNLGFVTDEHQINVALTRARKGLIIIGNANLLRTDYNWRRLLEEYRRKNCCVDARNFPSSKLY